MLTHKGTLAIETERLLLRKFSLEDANDMFSNWASDSAVTEYLSWQPHKTLDETRHTLLNWVEDYKHINTYSWCIALKEMNLAIGHIAVIEINDKNQRCELGYCLGKSYWRQGLMTEALNGVIPFLFYEVGVNRIQAKYAADNAASGKVMEKAGMKYEGALRQYKVLKDGTYSDSRVYSLLKEDQK